MAFHIIRNDIARVKADAIVNTANPSPVVGGGTDTAIYEAAGRRKLLAEREKIGVIARGDAAVTPAFHLKAKYIIHTVGPVWEGGDKGELDVLRSCYEKSLALAQELKCRSIAFPLIAAGSYGFPKDKALQAAMSVIQPFVMEHGMTVTLVVFDKKAFELSGKVVDNIREYVDSNYVEEANVREHSWLSGPRERRLRSVYEECERSCERAERMEDELDDGADYALPVFSAPALSKAAKGSSGKVDIPGLLENQEKTFQEKLFEIIDERSLTGPQVYKNYISKQVFSKIQADPDYHPNKYTAIALCLSLHLSLEETQDLIGRAGWALSPSKKADLVVRGCILNQEYNIVKINIILFDYDLPELEKIK